MKIKEIRCKTALGRCGFPGGGLAINPYVGCAHGCVYCYARFIKRFTGHTELWGCFVDVRVNSADVLQKQMRSSKFRGKRIYIGTVTDPYQPLEKKYRVTRSILQVLRTYTNPVSLLTKSDLVLRDSDLLKDMKHVDVNFTVTTLDEKWKKLTEPNSPTIKQRLKAMATLSTEGVPVIAMMGPYWPFFTNPDALFRAFKRVGAQHVFTESFNTIGGNWTGVEKVLKKHYPLLLPTMREILFNEEAFDNFYHTQKKKVQQLSKKTGIPVSVFFGAGHAAKFT